MKNTNIILNDFRCTCCGNKGLSIPRERRNERESGHLKKMYCFYCKEDKNFVEIKTRGNTYTIEMFKIEFEGGNFTKDGERKVPYKQFIGKYKHEHNLLQTHLEFLEQEKYKERSV